MDRNLFIQPSATIRVLEKSLLKGDFLKRISEMKDLKEIIRTLNDSVYKDKITHLESEKDYEKILLEEKYDLYKEAYKISPDRRVVDILALKDYYHNLKVLVKETVLEENLEENYIEIYNFNIEELKEDLKTENSKSNSFLYKYAKEAINKYKETKDPQKIDIIIDRLFFKNLKDLSRELKVDLITKYVEDSIDFTNISTLLRCKYQKKDVDFLKKVLIEGGNIELSKIESYLNLDVDEDSSLFKSTRLYKYMKAGISKYKESGSLTLFEKKKDNYFVDLIKEVKKITYGPEVIFAYIYAREVEIKNLRSIMIAVDNEMDENFILERLRDSYV